MRSVTGHGGGESERRQEGSKGEVRCRMEAGGNASTVDAPGGGRTALDWRSGSALDWSSGSGSGPVMQASDASQ